MTLLRLIFIIILGIGHAQSFAPYNLWELQILCLSILFYFAKNCSYKQASLLGWCFGVGWFTSGIWWLYISIHIYGQIHSLLAALLTLLFCGFLAIFPATALCLASLISTSKKYPTSLLNYLIPAASFAFCEWLRGTLFTGFPWLNIGYAHSDSLISGYAPIVGVYGMSFIAAILSILIAALITKAFSIKNFLVIHAIIAIILTIGWLGTKIEFTKSLNKAISVHIIQGNIAQDMKHDPDQLEFALQKHADLITKVTLKSSADLVITPETVFPFEITKLPENFRSRLERFALNENYILFGALGKQKQLLTNSLFSLNETYRYDKTHLVPFGEFTPRGFKSLMAIISMPLGQFISGDFDQKPLIIKGVTFAPTICYENLFGEEIAKRLRKYPANILINSSNIGWFGNTRALDQHLQISKIRSLETGLPLLSASNTGISAAIDHQGKIIKQLPKFLETSLQLEIYGRYGFTPFVRYGNKPFLLILITIFIYAIWQKYIFIKKYI